MRSASFVGWGRALWGTVVAPTLSNVQQIKQESMVSVSVNSFSLESVVCATVLVLIML